MNKTVVWWQAALFAFLLNVVTGLVILGFTRSANGTDKIKEELRQKAEKVDVEYQFIKMDKKVDEVKSDVDKTISRIDDNLKEIRTYILNKK